MPNSFRNLQASSPFISIRRSSLFLLTVLSFSVGSFLTTLFSRSLRRVQRYIERGGSNGGRRPVMVCLGDSITQLGYEAEGGWICRLQELYGRKADIINRGFSGYNTDWIARMLDDLFTRIFKRRPPALVLIWLGANDCTIPASSQHVPLENYKKNLEKMIKFFRRLAQKKDRQVGILLITPPPIHDSDWKATLKEKFATQPKAAIPPYETDRTHADGRRYVQAVVEVGKALKVPVVNMYDSMDGASADPTTYKKYLSDGLHLNYLGQKRAFEAIQRAICLNFPVLDPVNMEMQAPGWEEVRSVYLPEGGNGGGDGGEEGEGGGIAMWKGGGKEGERISLYSSKSSIVFDY